MSIFNFVISNSILFVFLIPESFSCVDTYNGDFINFNQYQKTYFFHEVNYYLLSIAILIILFIYLFI